MPTESQRYCRAAFEFCGQIRQASFVPFLGKLQVARSAFHICRDGVAPAISVRPVLALLFADFGELSWDIASLNHLLRPIRLLVKVNVAGRIPCYLHARLGPVQPFMVQLQNFFTI